MRNFVKKMYDHLEKAFNSNAGKFTGSPEALLYPPIIERLNRHQEDSGFKYQIFAQRGHVASSQIACFNVFLPIMMSRHAADILQTVKPDMKAIDHSRLDDGFCFEFWKDPFDDDLSPKGLLFDHSMQAGTDADFAVSYINHYDEPCLWLIEHKLTEKEFTCCNAFKSNKDVCRGKTTREIIDNPCICYYHRQRKYAYWELTKKHIDNFQHLDLSIDCPFKYGLCQLWRNMLLALEAKERYGYKHVHFSVIRPDENDALTPSMTRFSHIIRQNLFSWFSQRELWEKAREYDDLKDWEQWYKEHYILK